MSKLYKNYISLKIQDSSKFYLFKVGIFYIFIDEDAKVMSSILNLKLTNLNQDILKCGFPVKSANKYLRLLNSMNYNICVIDTSYNKSTELSLYAKLENISCVIKKFLNLDINNLSISEAFDTLRNLQRDFKKIFKV